jgi:chaperonin GroEL
MRKKEFKLGNDNREAIKLVAKQMGDIVGSTSGPGGRNYLLPTGITNDGKTIASHVRYDDECTDNIALAFQEIAIRTDRDAGDGTTGSLILGTKMALDLIDKVGDIDTPAPGDIPVMMLARQLEEEKEKVISLLQERATPVTTLAELENIARTSMENDEAAKLIAGAIWEAGKDSFTIIEEGFNGKLEKDVIPGVRYPLSVAAPYMYTNDKKEAVYQNVPVIVVNHPFEEYAELVGIMTSMIADKERKYPALVIVAKQFSIPFIGMCANMSRRSNFPILLLSTKMDNDGFEDIASFVDAQFVDTHPKGGRKITDVTIANAGFVNKIIAKEKETVLIGGRGLEAIVMHPQGEPQTRVQARVEAIRQQLDGQKDQDKRKDMEMRVASLLGGIATIYVDAKTAVERHYLKLKVEDAMNSCKAALEGGMLPGGGKTLAAVAEELGENSLLYGTLKEPLRRILMNAGGSLSIPNTVVDPFLVVKAGLQNAVSVVKVLLTTEGTIADAVPSMVESLQAAINTP